MTTSSREACSIGEEIAVARWRLYRIYPKQFGAPPVIPQKSLETPPNPRAVNMTDFGR